MSEKFKVERSATRQFRAKHIATGQEFELRGRQGVHYWAAYKIEKGSASKHIFLDDWQSKKRLLEELDKKIMHAQYRAAELAEIEERKKRERQEYLERKRKAQGRYRFRPEVYAKLQRKNINRNQTLLNAPESGEKFMMFQTYKDGYRIEHYPPLSNPQAICAGMGTEEEALLELYYYLDIPEISDNYRKTCFRER